MLNAEFHAVSIGMYIECSCLSSKFNVMYMCIYGAGESMIAVESEKKMGKH